MPAIDWIAINSQLNQVPPEPPDTPRIFAIVAPAVPAGITAKTTDYSSTALMEEDGWDTGDAAFNAAVQLFSQEPTATAVSRIVLIKRENPVANVWTVDIISTTDGNHTVSINGTLAATFAASGSTTTQIKDGLVAAFNGGIYGALITAASVDTDTLSLTADVPGVGFTPTSAAPGGTAPTVTETVANVGAFEDLDAAYPLSNFWGVLMPGALDVELDEGRRWAGADVVNRRNVMIGETATVGVYDGSDTTNIAVDWFNGEYKRAALLSHPTATDYMAAAWVGRVGGAFPGSRTWHFLVTEGSDETTITAARSLSQTQTMRQRFTSYTERFYSPADDLRTLGGYVSSGNFIYQVHAEDWWWYTIRQTVDLILQSNAGVNLDKAGLQSVCDKISQDMIPLVTAGVIRDDFTVTYEPLDLSTLPPSELSIGDFKTTGRILASATITPKLAALRVEAEFALV
jgi:hypothetical protein